jgi:nucleoside-diphosphate kinase
LAKNGGFSLLFVEQMNKCLDYGAVLYFYKHILISNEKAKGQQNYCEEDFSFMGEKTLAIIKPDGVSRHLIGNVVGRLEDKGLKIVAMKMIRMTKDQAKGFYKVHEGKPFFESVTDFMSSGPCLVMVLEGEGAIRKYRKLMGATNYKEAEEGTIRQDFAKDIEKNVVHGSDSEETARFEIGYFFSTMEIVGE